MKDRNNLQEGFFIENWYVQPDLGRLTNNGKKVQLEPKIMEVFVILAENQGKVVRKESFFRKVWEDVNVTEHVLARAISEIRKAFKEVQIIQTIPKIGYRLIVPVSAGTSQEGFRENARSPTGSFLYRPLLQINAANLLFFFGGLTTMFLVLIMFAIIFAGNSGGGFHSH